MENATPAELVALTEHPNGVIRATAYEGLLRKRHIDKYEILSKAFRDTTCFVSFVSGCTGEECMIGEYLVKYVLYWYDLKVEVRTETLKRYGLHENEIEYLDAVYQRNLVNKWAYYQKYNDPRN